MSKKTTTITTTKKSSNINKRRPRRNKVAKKPNAALYIAPCTKLYLKALVNPFNVQGSPCIPDSVILPSFKLTTKARGVFSTGPGGGGFCIMDPFKMIVNDNILDATHIDPPILFTDTGFAFNSIFQNNSGIPNPNVLGGNSNSILNSIDMSPAPAFANRQFRLVGAGLRIKYVGSNFRNQGQIAIFRKQGNLSIELDNPALNSFNDLMQDNYTSMIPVTRREQYVYYVPDDPYYIAYNPYADFETITGKLHYVMGFLINGGDTTEPQSWMYEAVAHFELVGNGFTLSRSEGDPVGHDLVLGSLPNTTPTNPAASVEATAFQRFIQGFSETTREVAYSAGRNIPRLAMMGYNAYRGSSSTIPTITMGE